MSAIIGGGRGSQAGKMLVGGLAVTTDRQTVQLTPTAGKKLRIWAYTISVATSSTFSAGAGNDWVDLSFDGASPVIMDIAVVPGQQTQMTFTLPYPIVGATNEKLDFVNANISAGTCKAFCKVWYDEVS